MLTYRQDGLESDECLLEGEVPWRYAQRLPPLTMCVALEESEKALRYCLRLDGWQHRSRLLLARLLLRQVSNLLT